MAIKVDFFDGIAKEIEGKLGRVSHLIDKSNLKSGEYHEQIIRQSLENFLPNRYSVKTGYIYLDEKRSSKQIDILLIDESDPNAYLFKDRDFVIVRPEPVIAAIEVKTQLKEREVREGFNNIATAKQLKAMALGGLHNHLYGSVFGYTSNVSLTNAVLGKWFNKIKFDTPELANFAFWPDSLFFFSHGLFLYLDGDKEYDKDGEAGFYYKLFRKNEKADRGWQLALLIAFLVAKCNLENNSRFFTKIPLGPSTNNFVDTSDAERSFDRFRPQEGHSIFK